ncbi:hypothetical protein [Mycobacterium colombiense]|uniref:hypothetical protein n=1 Tax=Mycobacterium colombiense TaxID=339268 RepID=UPI0012DB7501|nr:hypothetical protein [Mycobacterium colombiense]
MKPGPLCGPALAKLVVAAGAGAAWAMGAPLKSSAPATAPAPRTPAAAPHNDRPKIIEVFLSNRLPPDTKNGSWTFLSKQGQFAIWPL